MKLSLPRFTVRRMMAVIASTALILGVAIEIDPVVGEYMMRETMIRPTNWAYARPVVVLLLTGAVAVPFLWAVALIRKLVAKDQSQPVHRWRQLIKAFALFSISAGIATFPMDGLRFSQQLRSGTHIQTLYRYRLWPGRHAELTLEVFTSDEKRVHYPVIRKTGYFASKLLTNADQSLIWLVDQSYTGHRSDGVLCSLNLLTGHFVGPSGPHPPGVSETGGFSPTPNRMAPTPSPAGQSSNPTPGLKGTSRKH